MGLTVYCNQRDAGGGSPECALIVGAFVPGGTPAEAERTLRQVEDTVRSRHLIRPLGWDRIRSPQRDGYREVLSGLAAGSPVFHAVVASSDDLPTAGRCAQVYRAYREVLIPWLSSADEVCLVLDPGFEESACGGRGCRVVYVGGSDCASGRSDTAGGDRGHLRADDLLAVVERTVRPGVRLGWRYATDDDRLAMECLDVFLGAAGRLSGAPARGVAQEAVAISVAEGCSGAMVDRLQDGKQALTCAAAVKQGDPELFDPDDLPEGERI